MNTYKSRAFKFFVGTYIGYTWFVKNNLEDLFANLHDGHDINRLSKKKSVNKLKFLCVLFVCVVSLLMVLGVVKDYFSGFFNQYDLNLIYTVLFSTLLGMLVLLPLFIFACIDLLSFVTINEVFNEFRNYQARHYHEFTVKRCLDNDRIVIVDNDKTYTSSEFKLDKFDKVRFVVKRSFDNLVESHADNITYERTFVVPEIDPDVFRTLTDVERKRLNHILYTMSCCAKSDKIVLLEPTIINKRVIWVGTVSYDEKKGYWYNDKWHEGPFDLFDL